MSLSEDVMYDGCPSPAGHPVRPSFLTFRNPGSSEQSGMYVSGSDIPNVIRDLNTNAVQPSEECDSYVGMQETSTHNVISNTWNKSSTEIVSRGQRDNVTTNHSEVTGQENSLATIAPSTNASAETRKNSIRRQTEPKYSQYSSEHAREATFGSIVLAVSSHLLSYAGFFLVPNSEGDATRCFYCGIGLRHWSKDDDPWVEHARFSPNCDYLLKMKGQEFVNLIQVAVQVTSNHAAQLDLTSSKSTSDRSVQSNNPEATAQLQSPMKCMYCDRREVSLVFLPCGHLISCEGCGPRQKTCRTCGASVKGTVRTFRW